MSEWMNCCGWIWGFIMSLRRRLRRGFFRKTWQRRHRNERAMAGPAEVGIPYVGWKPHANERSAARPWPQRLDWQEDGHDCLEPLVALLAAAARDVPRSVELLQFNSLDRFNAFNAFVHPPQ